MMTHSDPADGQLPPQDQGKPRDDAQDGAWCGGCDRRCL